MILYCCQMATVFVWERVCVCTFFLKYSDRRKWPYLLSTTSNTGNTTYFVQRNAQQAAGIFIYMFLVARPVLCNTCQVICVCYSAMSLCNLYMYWQLLTSPGPPSFHEKSRRAWYLKSRVWGGTCKPLRKILGKSYHKPFSAMLYV